MGKIFGISDLPVSTFDKALSQVEMVKPVLQSLRIPRPNPKNVTKADAFVKTANRKPSIKNK